MHILLDAGQHDVAVEPPQALELAVNPVAIRVAGSIALAIAAFLWIFRERLHLLTSLNDALVVFVIVLIFAIIAYRAWPAFEIILELSRTAAGRQAMWTNSHRVVGAMGFSALILLALFMFLRTLSSNITVEWSSMLRSFLVLTLLGYFVYPKIFVSWRRWRTR
jgi:hypothetical protein